MLDPAVGALVPRRVFTVAGVVKELLWRMAFSTLFAVVVSNIATSQRLFSTLKGWTESYRPDGADRDCHGTPRRIPGFPDVSDVLLVRVPLRGAAALDAARRVAVRAVAAHRVVEVTGACLVRVSDGPAGVALDVKHERRHGTSRQGMMGA